jgi:gluconate 2-dehydrogenase gamma chain
MTRGLAAGVSPENRERWLALFQESTPVAIEDYTPVALTDEEFATLRAAVNRIIPSDDLGPGADEAGVPIFIDRALVGPYAGQLEMYQAGLAAIAGATETGTFAELIEDEQDEILVQAEEQGLSDDTAGFFGLLLEHTRQGMFGDPIYGGNINFAGWDLIGYPGIKLIWAEEEQQLNVDVQPEHTSVEEYGGTGW